MKPPFCPTCGAYMDGDKCFKCGYAKPQVLHLSAIENPDLGPDPIRIVGVVSSSSLCYLVPKTILFTWLDRDGLRHEEERYIDLASPDNIKFTGVGEHLKLSSLTRIFGIPFKAAVDVVKHRAVYKLRVRPPVFTLETRDNRVVDEEGREYKPYDVYVASETPLQFQPSSRILLIGHPLPDPKSQRATLLATSVDFPDSIDRFNREALVRLYAKLASLTVRERVDWVLSNFEEYSHVVGRQNLAIAALLAFFTPTWIRFNGDTQRGWGLILIVGDTTTGKSETVRKLIKLLGAGTLITAETASAVGLTGTATQVEGGEWFTDWGFLVLNDRGLLAIDGAQKLSRSAWATLAEAERTGMVVKATAAKGSAPARTRQIKIANGVDLDKGRYSTKSISSFLYPIQAVATVLDKTSLARLDLVAISDQRTVKPEEVNQLRDGVYDPDLELLGEAVKWCWSGRAEVRFTDEAVIEILSEATRLYRAFHSPSIPVVDVNMKWKLARLSAALAYLTLSTTPEFDEVVVAREHVEEVVRLLEREYREAGLNALARGEEYDVLSVEDAAEVLQRVAASIGGSFDKAVAVLKWIPLRGGFTRSQLMEKFSLAERSELRPLLAVMQNEGLIKASGRGFTPLPRLVQLYKLLEGPEASEVMELANMEGESRAPSLLSDYAETEEGGGADSGVGRVGRFGGMDTSHVQVADSANSAKARGKPPTPLKEPEGEIQRFILRHCDEKGVGYLRLKKLVELHFDTGMTVPEFEGLLVGMDRRGLIRFNGITVERRVLGG